MKEWGLCDFELAELDNLLEVEMLFLAIGITVTIAHAAFLPT